MQQFDKINSSFDRLRFGNERLRTRKQSGNLDPSELRHRKERIEFFQNKVQAAEEELTKAEQRWVKLDSSIKAAEKLLKTRRALRHEIAGWREEMTNVEEEGKKASAARSTCSCSRPF